MATRIPGRDITIRSTKYPWHEWLDGSVWQLTPGEDFTVSADAFRTAADAAARRQDGKIRTVTENGCLLIQFTGNKPW